MDFNSYMYEQRGHDCKLVQQLQKQEDRPNALHTLYINRPGWLRGTMLNTNRGIYDYYECQVTSSCPLFEKGKKATN